MDQRLRNFYVESRVKNASSGELLVLLYDGLVETAENAELELAAPVGSPERANAPLRVARCLDMVRELMSSLRPECDPALCASLTGLYRFFGREFSEALAQGDAGKITGILPLIRRLRTTWTQAQKSANKTKAEFAVA